MRGIKWFLSTLACTCLFSSAVAQAPGTVAAGTAAAQANAPGAVAVAASAPQPGFCEKLWIACEDCKRRLCAMPLGAMFNSMTKPMSGLSGGIIPNFCPEMPAKEDLAKPGVEGASAQAKKDALEAKARRQSVRYLGTLDCRYYPEAEGALIAALRTDGVECVRWEAAIVLGKGCCCSKKTIEALTISVSGSEKDGNPAERSERVRMAAAIALDRCLACYCEVVPEPEKPVENGKEKAPPPREKPPVEIAPPQASRRPDKQTIAAGKDALNKFYGHFGIQSRTQQVEMAQSVRIVPTPANASVTTQQQLPTNPQMQQPVTMKSMNSLPVAPKREPRSLYSVLRDSFGGSASTTVAATPVMNAPTVAQPMPVMQPMRQSVVTQQTVMPWPTNGQSMQPTAVSAAALKTPVAAQTVPPPEAASSAAKQGTYIYYDPPAPAPKR